MIYSRLQRRKGEKSLAKLTETLSKQGKQRWRQKWKQKADHELQVTMALGFFSWSSMFILILLFFLFLVLFLLFLRLVERWPKRGVWWLWEEVVGGVVRWIAGMGSRRCFGAFILLFHLWWRWGAWEKGSEASSLLLHMGCSCTLSLYCLFGFPWSRSWFFPSFLVQTSLNCFLTPHRTLWRHTYALHPLELK